MISLAKTPRRALSGLAVGALTTLLLAGCAAQTVVEPQPLSGTYSVGVKLDPPTLNPPQLGTLTYAITDAKTGKPVNKLELVSGALVHSVLISRDLRFFRHSYTTELVDNQASVYTYFPISSNYFNYAIFKPGGGDQQVLRTNVNIIGSSGSDAQLVEDPSPHKTAGWLTFDLLRAADPIKAGQATQLAFYITERGRPVTALWPYLGAPGHLWTVDEKGDNFGHEVGTASGHQVAPAPGTTPQATGTAESTQGSTSGSSSTGGTGGTGAGGAGGAGTRSGGLGTVEPEPTLGPSPTLVAGVQQALTTAVAQPTTQLAPVQETAQSSILGTPEIVPSVGYGPTVAFTHTFPKPGLYKLWLEVYYRGQPVLVDYVVRVQ